MQVDQYVYFALKSRSTPAAAMTAFLGIEPDEVMVRGTKLPSPPVPVVHAWMVVCREPGRRVDHQAACVLARLIPHTERIADLARRLDAEVEDGEGSAVLEVVRYLRPTEDTPTAANLLGWWLDRDALAFLAATGASLDVDEYDMTPGPDEEP
ncbi:DUF4279 domain-containing protein [Uniformispora flossi]|uniref:DUF4279 domain-containing protein n=1 Tax=Uniformispora flossi TaxID=3390723 RepID=UPI003C2B9142